MTINIFPGILGLAPPEIGGVRVAPFDHPYAAAFRSALAKGGVDALYDPALQAPDPADFLADYGPGEFVKSTPEDSVDFSECGPYSDYNWELFFHAPLLAAKRLMEAGRYRDAQRWLHRVFDPTVPGDGTSGQRFWKFRLFRDEAMEFAPVLARAHAELEVQIERWRDNPFDPHLIARMRPFAYQTAVIMAYVENLLQWGDSLFSQDTLESVTDASQLYSSALRVMGPRPQLVSRPTEEVPKSLDELLSAPRAGFDYEVFLGPGASDIDRTAHPSWGAVSFSTYFNVPFNPKLTEYWDRVEDRLYKVRNCLDIRGVFRHLPLFAPPIDPALLVRARALGLDMASVLDDAAVRAPLHRFERTLGRALDLAQSAAGLGSALLSAIEKQDAERLAALRADRDIEMQTLLLGVNAARVAEAKKQLASTRARIEVVEGRLSHYQGLLRPRQAGSGTGGVLGLNEDEQAQFDRLDDAAEHEKEAGERSEKAAIRSSTIPSISFGTVAMKPQFSTSLGGQLAGFAMRASAQQSSTKAGVDRAEATKLGMQASFQRRAEDWRLQISQAELELKQLSIDEVGAEIRVDIAQKEQEAQSRRVAHAQTEYRLLQSKFTSEELYGWMAAELSHLYRQTFGLALTLSKQAQNTLRFELADQQIDLIRLDSWETARRGLLAAERLLYDLRRLQLAADERNEREFELTRTFSLQEIAPMGLIELRHGDSSAVEFSLREIAFDEDHPGHYLRRIRGVSVSFPTAVGGHRNVNAELFLIRSHVRPRPYTDVSAFDLEVAPRPRASMIATSSGNLDSGLFDPSGSDGRLAPFEGAGAISDWRLSVEQLANRTDLRNLSDILVHVRYTARFGGEHIRQRVCKRLEDEWGADADQPLTRVIDLGAEFPDAFQALGEDQEFEISLSRSHFSAPGGWTVTVHGFEAPQDPNLVPPDVAPLGVELGEPTEFAFTTATTADPGAPFFLIVHYSIAP